MVVLTEAGATITHHHARRVAVYQFLEGSSVAITELEAMRKSHSRSQRRSWSVFRMGAGAGFLARTATRVGNYRCDGA